MSQRSAGCRLREDSKLWYESTIVLSVQDSTDKIYAVARLPKYSSRRRSRHCGAAALFPVSLLELVPKNLSGVSFGVPGIRGGLEHLFVDEEEKIGLVQS